MSLQTIHRIESHLAEDEAAVRALYGELMAGWNKASGEAFAAPFAEDGHLVAFDGTHFESRRDIASFHQPLFDKWLEGTRLVGGVKRVQFLASSDGAQLCRGAALELHRLALEVPASQERRGPALIPFDGGHSRELADRPCLTSGMSIPGPPIRQSDRGREAYEIRAR